MSDHQFSILSRRCDALYQYQVIDARWMSQRRFAFLLNEMGTGKTPTSIRAADLAGIQTGIIVIAPGIALFGWLREFERWQTVPRSLQVIRSAKDAQDLWGDVIFISSTLLARVLPQLLAHWTFSLAIVDEAQHFKNPGAKRTAALFNSKGIITNTRRMWLLSGTLMLNAPHELWPSYAALLGGTLSYAAFKHRYCIMEQTPFGMQVAGARLDRLPELTAKFAPHVTRRLQQDVLADLPPLRFVHTTLTSDDVLVVEVPDEVLAILEKLEENKELDADERMHLTTLMRATSKAKAPAIVEMLKDDLEGISKIVVFAIFRETIQTIVDGLGGLAVAIHGGTPQRERQARIDAFQTADQPRVLVCQLTVAGTAITLTAASHCAFADVGWTPAALVQAAKRLHRIGQTKSVLARVISLADSIDEVIAGTLARKAHELSVFDDLLREAS